MYVIWSTNLKIKYNTIMRNFFRLGFMTDGHIRGTTPVDRIDNFYKSIQAKHIEIGEIFEREQVDAILHGGDIYDSADVGTGIITDSMEIFKQYSKHPIITVIGSHDYTGYQVKTLRRAGLGVLQSAEVFQVCGSGEKGEDIILDLPFFNRPVRVVGTSHSFDLSEHPERLFEKKKDENEILIQLTHGDLMEKDAPWNNILIENINTEADIVFGAHYHPGWTDNLVRNINGRNVTFIHPGSIARLDNTGVRRIPRVAIVDVYDTGEVKIKYVSLKTAIDHPFREKIKVSKEDKSMSDIKTLVQKLAQTKMTKIDVKERIIQTAKELEYDNEPEIVELALELASEGSNNNDND